MIKPMDYKLNIVGTSSYVADITRILNTILQSRVGKLLLNSIRFHNKPVWIAPFSGTGCNATANGNTTRATGRGTYVIAFSPDLFRTPHGACGAEGLFGARGFLPKEILFHELFHAFRMVSRKFSSPTLEGTSLMHFSNEEEFNAVVVTNTFISDPTNRSKSGLRSSHDGGLALGPEFAKPFGMFSRGPQVLRLIQNLLTTNRGFAGGVAALHDIPFNPLAELARDPGRAMAASMRSFTPLGLVQISTEIARSTAI